MGRPTAGRIEGGIDMTCYNESERKVHSMPLKATETQARYDSTHTRRYGLKYNTTTDADIIAHLEKQESIQGYIKSLIRQDIAKQEGEKDNEQQAD